MENEEYLSDEFFENPRPFLDQLVADIVEGVGEERAEADPEPIPEPQPKRQVAKKRSKWAWLRGRS